MDGSYLPEDERHWEMHLHVRDLAKLRDPLESTEYKLDAVIEFNYDIGVEEMLSKEYRVWKDTFEDAFPEAELYFLKTDP